MNREIRFGVLTVSDRASRGEQEDLGGPAVAQGLERAGWTVSTSAVVPDDAERIAEMLREWSDEQRLDVILTTGGTGLGPRDVTPEATLRVADREVPGIAEALRAASLAETPQAMLSRGRAALRGTTLIINLPGSPRGASFGVDVLRPVLEHAVATIHGSRH